MTRPGSSYLLTAVALLTLTASHRLGAQVPREVNPGDRIRVTAPELNLRRRVGTVVDAEPESIVVRFEGGEIDLRVDRPLITKIEVPTGERKTQGLRGLGLGAAVGFGLGATMGLVSGDDDPGLIAFSAEEKAAVLGVSFGVIGGLVGAVAGHSRKAEVWAPLQDDGPWVSLVPLVGRGGAGLGVRIGM